MVGREMNAYELADQLERDVKDFFPIPDEVCLQAVTMLRQLQKEKDELQVECNRLYRTIELNGTLK